MVKPRLSKLRQRLQPIHAEMGQQLPALVGRELLLPAYLSYRPSTCGDATYTTCAAGRCSIGGGRRALGTAYPMGLPAYVALLGGAPPQPLPKAGFVQGRLPPSCAAGGPFGARLPPAKPAARTSPSLGRLRLSNGRCGMNMGSSGFFVGSPKM